MDRNLNSSRFLLDAAMKLQKCCIRKSNPIYFGRRDIYLIIFMITFGKRMQSSPRSFAKPILKPPFTIQWPETPKSSTDSIVFGLRSRLESLQFFRPKIAENSSLRKRPKIEGGSKSAAVCDSKWNDSRIKSQLALGLNEVLRALEQKKLRVAIFDSDHLKPKTMSYFTGLAAKDSDAVVGTLKGFSELLAKTMRIKAVRSFGIRKVNVDSKVEDFFAGEVELIRQHLRPVEIIPNFASSSSKSATPKYVSPAVITPSVKPKRKKKRKN